MRNVFYANHYSYLDISKVNMQSSKDIIKKSKSRIGDLDQAAIKHQNAIDVRVAFNEGGTVRLHTVRFYRDKIDEPFSMPYA